MLQNYGRNSKLLIAAKDIPDFQFNVDRDSEFLEHSQNSLELVEVMETDVLQQIVKGELMVTSQSSENREHSGESLTGVVDVAPEQLFVESKVKTKSTGNGKGCTSKFSKQSQDWQRSEVCVALQRPTKKPASSNIRVQQLNFSESSVESLKSWPTRGNHGKNDMRNRNGDRHE